MPMDDEVDDDNNKEHKSDWYNRTDLRSVARHSAEKVNS
jgi:hypothetical protein